MIEGETLAERIQRGPIAVKEALQIALQIAEALESADHGYVLETGRVVLQGDNTALRADDRVRQAYLGM